MYPVVLIIIVGLILLYRWMSDSTPIPTPEPLYEAIPDVKEEPIRRVRCPHCNYLTDVQAFGWKDCTHGHKYLPMYGCTNCKGNVTVHPCNKNGHMCAKYDAGPDEWTGEHHPSSIRLRGPLYIGYLKPGDDP